MNYNVGAKRVIVFKFYGKYLIFNMLYGSVLDDSLVFLQGLEQRINACSYDVAVIYSPENTCTT